MDPVDVLTFAATAAQLIRSSGDPETALASGFAFLDEPAPDPSESLAVRVARLIDSAGDRRRDLMDHLRANSGPLPLNRAIPDDTGELVDPDPEAERLADYANDHEDAGRPMFGAGGFGAFLVAGRTASGYFGGRTIIVRDGKRLTIDEAGDLKDGDEMTTEADGLPLTVRCLLDYPLEVPVLFTIETGDEPWDMWAICCAIADEYARVYQTPEKFGVWGHDLADLVIEELLYFPKERLIYPLMGS